jgi:putative spermidine/putrescine transport system substrate-binding protein
VGSIPDSAKDADGFWYGDYYGVLAFEVNTDIVQKVPAVGPTCWRPTMPTRSPWRRSPANQAIRRSSPPVVLRKVDKAGDAGLKFFAELNKKGNFVPVIGKAGTLAQGATPIIIRWDYNALADRDTLKDNPKVEVVVPKSGVVAGVYIQAISAFAPHPNAAKLWMEYLYSDEGQLGWLAGYCHPIRFQDLVKHKKVSDALLAKLPPAAGYKKAVFPTLDEQAASTAVITKQWDSVVGANVK